MKSSSLYSLVTMRYMKCTRPSSVWLLRLLSFGICKFLSTEKLWQWFWKLWSLNWYLFSLLANCGCVFVFLHFTFRSHFLTKFWLVAVISSCQVGPGYLTLNDLLVFWHLRIFYILWPRFDINPFPQSTKKLITIYIEKWRINSMTLHT